MDTKWKRWKLAVSFLAFFLGLTLLIVGGGTLLANIPWDDSVRGGSGEYQDTAAFRQYISDRLDIFISAAQRAPTVGGNWSAAHDRAVRATTVEAPAQWWAPGMDDAGLAAYWDETMAYIAKDENLLYTLVNDGTVVYTNVPGVTGGYPVVSRADLMARIDTEKYNFFLCFSGDSGTVELWQDGQQLDVYGNGIYTGTGDQWFLPGYDNFRMEVPGVEVYLAAAAQPALYYFSDNGGYMTGWELRDIWSRTQAMVLAYQRSLAMVCASAVLLLLALAMRKSLCRAHGFILRQTARVWPGIKIPVLLVIPTMLFALAVDLAPDNAAVIAGMKWAIVFWPLYLLALDLIGNRGRQKRPLRGTLARDLSLPVQQRLIKRDRLIAVLGAAAIIAAIAGAGLTLAALDSAEFGWALLGAACTAAAVFVGIALLRRVKQDHRLAADIGLLSDQIDRVKGGDLTTPLVMPEDADLYHMAEALGGIQQGLETALHERMQSERTKIELITNVSHDLKTPLTSIISYTELLRREQDLPQNARDFVEVIWDRAQRLKVIVQDVFEVSKAAAGQLPLKMEPLDMGKLLRQTMADMSLPIENSGLALKASIPEGPVMINADGQRLYRVFQNLLQNALMYSLPGSRVYLTLMADGGKAAARLQNTSAAELDSAKDFTERFVRGDDSRTDGSSGLGLSIASTFTAACGGDLTVDIDADLFTVTVCFDMI